MFSQPRKKRKRNSSIKVRQHFNDSLFSIRYSTLYNSPNLLVLDFNSRVVHPDFVYDLDKLCKKSNTRIEIFV